MCAGLNCYSCPAASGACPIGAFQAVVGSSKFRFSYYITGFLILDRRTAGTLCLRIPVPLRMVSGAAPQDTDKKALHKQAEAADLHQIRCPSGHGGSASDTHHQRCGHGGSVLLQVSVSAGRSEGAIPHATVNSGYGRLWVHSFLEARNTDRSGRAERAVLPSVLQVAVPAGRVLRASEQGVPARNEGGQAQMRFLREMRKSL